ncbi:hypothetical protein G4S02_004765 [Salmonella enterica]|nr:hypothetical protein [Salmonella enterica]EJC4647952.1 hypothetical protein [Salmonella enterica]
MVKFVGDIEGQKKYLEAKISEIGYHLPSNSIDKDYRAYQQRVLQHLIVHGKEENWANGFLTKVERDYLFSAPSEIDMEWYRNDPRASLWLACTLYSDRPELPGLSGDNFDYLSPKNLQPDHNVRIQKIKIAIDNWPRFFEVLSSEYIRKKGMEWASLMDKHDLFRLVRSSKVDVSGWLKTYIQERTPMALNRVCGNSPDEIFAWCYASYFIWRKENSHNPDSIELIERKFKGSWSTQKNRIKNKEEKKLKTVNINIPENIHDMLRYLAVEGNISNDKVIEHAVKAAYDRIKKHSK